MTDHVIDASVAAKWFKHEDGSELALQLLGRHKSGADSIHAPRLLLQELINAAARKWHLKRADLLRFADRLLDLSLLESEPAPQQIADWSARGLTAYDATYVALAQSLGVNLVSEDDVILAVAPQIARSLT